MGRPIKIKKTQTIDQGFNIFNLLDQPTVVIPAGMTGDEFLGVVGGGYPGGVATSTFPTVAATAFVPQLGAEDDVYIIAQKGSTKYLVATQTPIAVTAITPGFTYIVNTLGDTNWQTVGAGTNVAVGDVFTATAVGVGSGVVNDVGVVALANVAAGALSSGEMQITVTSDSTVFQASKITNKYVWDYSVPAVKYAADFFVGGSAQVTTAKSGAQIDTWTNGTGDLDLGQVTDYTS